MAVVPAAGRGARMGGNTPKQFLTLGGIPVLIHPLRILNAVDAITGIVLVVPETDRHYCEKEILEQFHIKKVTQVVAGGQRRQDSVRKGLLALTDSPDYVLVHDGVRPFLTKQMVKKAIESAILSGASVVAIPMRDTVKRVNPTGLIESTLNREELWLAQTPQVFRVDWLIKAHEVAENQNLDVTDDATLVERLGYPVAVVSGNVTNIKITRPEDLKLGEAILAAEKA